MNNLYPSTTQTYTFTWNTASILSGSYTVSLILYENGTLLTEVRANFAIVPEKTLSSKLATDKISYYPNQPVVITSTITSLSPNYIFDNLTAKIVIANNTGIALFADTKTIPVLTSGQMSEFRTYWNTSTNPPGVYPVTLTIYDEFGTALSVYTALINISGEIKPAKLLKGQINVDKQRLLQGENVAISYSLTNIGNIDLQQVGISIMTVNAANTVIYDTLTDQTALLLAGTYAGSKQLNTDNYTAKDYLVILKANISGTEETIAGTYFRVEGAPSSPSLHSPLHLSDIQATTPLLTVNNAADPNDDKLTYEFELYSDSNLSNLIASSGLIAEATNITSWHSAPELQENAVYYWRARAFDGILYGEWMLPASFRINVENDVPTAPTLSWPTDSSEVSSPSPSLTVNNAFDPDSWSLTYNFELSLDAGFSSIVASEIGIFEGSGTTSWQVPLMLNENTYYYWRARADDWFIEGHWMPPAKFFVNTANDAPSAAQVIAPSNGFEISTATADVVISNSTDPDFDQLMYIFEIDTAMTFDSPLIIRSEYIPEGQLSTSWQVGSLSDNTYYFVRVKATDGLAESHWSDVSGFFVNTANDALMPPVLSNPSDGSGVNSFNPVLSIHNSFDIDRDALTYEFEIYSDISMIDLISSATGVEETSEITSWILPVSLTENQIYYWRVRAYDAELHSSWMPLSSFMVNTANDAPTAPLLYMPAHGSSLNTLHPTLSIYNATDPDSDSLTYDFEIYSNGTLIRNIAGIPQNVSGITAITLSTSLSDNTTYNWRAKANDGDRYGAWIDMATFSIYLPSTTINATIDFDPDTLNKKSKGTWIVIYIELPKGFRVEDIKVSSILLNGVVLAEPWPYSVGDYDNDGIPDIAVKFRRDNVINILPSGNNAQIIVKGSAGAVTFEGRDVIRVIP